MAASALERSSKEMSKRQAYIGVLRGEGPSFPGWLENGGILLPGVVVVDDDGDDDDDEDDEEEDEYDDEEDDDDDDVGQGLVTQPPWKSGGRA